MSSPDGDELAGVYRRYLAAVVLFHQVAAAEIGLGATDYQACNLLELQGPMTSGRLASSLGLTTGATTRLIDRLVAAGYVNRVADDTDRRRVLVQHTGAIDPRLTHRLKAVQGPIADAISALDDHQRDGLLAYLRAAEAAYSALIHGPGAGA